MKRRFFVLSVMVTTIVVMGWSVVPARGIELAEGLDLGGYFKNETYIRAWHGPDDIMSCRNLLNLDLEYNFPRGSCVKRFFIQLRPFYDAVFDWENEGTGGVSRGRYIRGREYLERLFSGDFFISNPLQQNRHMREKFEDNFGVADDWDPLLRECWVELEAGDLYARIGRQLVSWGRSDGIFLLDLIHPFNFRNAAVFEEEDTKIPLWMLNLTYSFSPNENLQLLVIPRYVPQYDAGDGHDWAANVVNYVEDFYADPGAFLAIPGLLGSASVRFDEPNWGDPSNWEWGIRWGGAWKGITYSLNYFYTWDDVLNDYPQDPFGVMIKRNPDRLTVIGGSFDYAFADALWMENWVFRGEVAFFKNDVFVDAHFHNREKDHIEVMLGFDKFFFVDYWVSIQLYQSWILDSPSWRNCFMNPSARLKTILTVPGVGKVPISEGFRDGVETTMSFFVLKDFMPGDWLHTAWFLLWTDEGDWWFRPYVKMDYTTNIHFSVGCNLYWGSEHDFWGQLHNNDNVFFEFKYDF